MAKVYLYVKNNLAHYVNISNVNDQKPFLLDLKRISLLHNDVTNLLFQDSVGFNSAVIQTGQLNCHLQNQNIVLYSV